MSEEVYWKLWGETSAYTVARPATGCRCQDFFGLNFRIVDAKDGIYTLKPSYGKNLVVTEKVLLTYYLFPSD